MMSIRRIGGCSILVVALVSCSDDLIGPVPGEFEQLCGQDGPVKLLDLDPSLRPDYVRGRELADRYVFSVDTIDEAEDEVISEVWSVERCGEDPILLAEGSHFRQRVFQQWPELLFVCDHETGVMSAVDPTGAVAPNPVFETRDCFVWPTDDGVLTILGEGDTGPLVLQTWPADPTTEGGEQIVVLDEVKARAPAGDSFLAEHDVFVATLDEMFAITPADELVEIGFDDLTPSVIAEGVRQFVIGGPEFRWIVWQGVEITNDDPDWPEGPLFVLDRQTGESHQLEDGALAFTHFFTLGAASLGFLYYETGLPSSGESGRWIRLDTFETIDVPASIGPIRALDESRILVGSPFWSPFHVFDLNSGQLNTIFSGSFVSAGFLDDGIRILRGNGDELIHVDYDGGSRTLARHAHQRFYFTSDEHVITPYAVDADELGSLVIVDPSTLEERYIEEADVLAWSLSVLQDAADELLVSYAILDEDPERRGIWLAKPSR